MAKKASVDPVAAAEQAALQALNELIADPSAALFAGTGVKIKQAAVVAVQRGWVTAVEEKVGKKTVKSYRITPAGINHALTNGEPTQQINAMSRSIADTGATIRDIGSMLKSLESKLQSQTEVVERLAHRIVPPNLSELLQQTSASSESKSPVVAPTSANRDSLSIEILRYLHDFKRRANAGQYCTLKELYVSAAESLHATIGEFHACLRELDRQRKLRLGPWTAPMSQLDDEIYAMIAGKEVKFYVYLDN